MQVERWRPIPGYEGVYDVSDRGRVRSLDRYVEHAYSGKQFVRGRLMRAGLDGKGYWRLVLKCGGAFKSCAVHRAVLAAFAPIPDWRTKHVNHKDGRRTNNSLENLEWCTPAENSWHSFYVLGNPTPPSRRGSEHPNAIPIVGFCIATGDVRRYSAISETRRDGFKPSDVSSTARGDQRSHRGWMWRYAEQAEQAPWKYEPTSTKGELNSQAKAVECVRPDGSVKQYAAAVLAAADGFNPVGISHVLVGRQARHRGCEWRLVREAA